VIPPPERKPHDFNERLRWAEAQTAEPYWDKVYRLWFPDYLQRLVLPDGTGQRRGRDSLIVLKNGDTLRVQEKARERLDTGDILLEYEHRYANGRTQPGWMAKDESCDYLAYVFVPSRAGYLFPFQPLRVAWLRNKSQWLGLAERNRDGFRRCPAQNRDYTTWSVAVPIDVLYPAVGSALRVHWPEEE
jgi:hypothetical protein